MVVPTRNEADNVDALLNRLSAALHGADAEVVIVDDSDDNTPEVVRRQAEARRATFPVRLVHREPGERAGGLGTAVVAGFKAAKGEWVVVMDGDLQHPPEVVPRLIAAGDLAVADVVVASRHVDGGDDEGLSGLSRVLVSGTAGHLAKWMFPLRLRGVSDPMSGFFAVRRSALRLDELQPDGFKILMEILVRTPGLKRVEVGFVFEERAAGESKASLAEGMRFAKHLTRLSLSRLSLRRRRTRRAVGFGAVGATGIAVNTGALWLLADPGVLALNYLLAAVIATQVSTTWNFANVERFVYRGEKSRRLLHRYLIFSGMNNAVLLLRVPLLALLVSVMGVNYLLANVATLFLSFVVRFATSDRVIYRLEQA